MKLKLIRPLVFFDLETTGLDIVSDRIVELSYYKLYPNGSSESKTYRINPEMPIPESSSKIHGIYDEDVRDCPTFRQLSSELVTVLEGCDLAGYNSNHFDVPMLAEELLRAGIDFDLKKCKMVDAFVIFQKNEPRNLTAAYKFYCNKDLTGAHSADADTLATAEVLLAQLERYPDLPDNVDKLAAYTTQQKVADYAGKILFNDKGEEVFGFGKYKGQPVKEVLLKDCGYYGWMMQGNFPQYTKNLLTRLYIQARRK
ncbi:MAG: exonuclease domain-containing protein [Paludibacter sp.]|nr:exonuclease domain-containing protein [Bacteroidales bacterium]MCM1069752.1 exonuclease domain-containing protein [Prevotella sp.]MCM1354437.1 exonuclease domain-containing protein [Bacteroides sp.]MCM1443225.1 exonuclease domain-containing protein [Muribaculum sp.]MCM1482471.1 exonuclease domain-containing protein [Paludibacter sp.]